MLPISPLKRVQALIQEHKKEVTSIYLFSILGGIVNLSLPLGVQTIIGLVMGATMVTSIYVLIFLVVLGVFLMGLFQINQMKIIESIQQKIFAHYAYDFAQKLPSLDLKQMDKYHIPEKVNRFFDDERFCESFVSGKVRIKRWGRIKIRYELKLKGIKEEVIRKALLEIDPLLYEENLLTLAQRKWAESKGDEWTRKAKVQRFLATKGYENDLIIDALKSLI